MDDVRFSIIEFDAQGTRLRDNDGPAFTPSGWSFVNYLHSTNSWSVQLLPQTTRVMIGVSGTTGNANGEHLHFEIRSGSAYGTVLNPMDYLP